MKVVSLPTSIMSSVTFAALTAEVPNALTIDFAMLMALVTLFAPKFTPQVIIVP